MNSIQRIYDRVRDDLVNYQLASKALSDAKISVHLSSAILLLKANGLADRFKIKQDIIEVISSQGTFEYNYANGAVHLNREQIGFGIRFLFKSLGYKYAIMYNFKKKRLSREKIK